MTVALGLVCADGVVVASDSQGTSENLTAAQAIKVQRVAGLPAVWTASGTVYCIEEVQQETNQWASNHTYKKAIEGGDLNGIRSAVGDGVRGALGRAYETALPMGLQQVQPGGAHVFHTSFLFLGWANNQPWFLEVDGSGQLNWHTGQRFKAVGSGGAFADVAGAVMFHLIEGEDLSLDLGLQVAYRAIETTCEVSSGLVGGRVQLGMVNSEGARILTEEEVTKVQDEVTGWKQMERELLRGALAAAPVEQPPTIEEIEEESSPVEAGDV